VPIEPRLSEQWFLKYPSVEKSLACVEQESSAGVSPAQNPGGAGETPALPYRMHFHPQRWAKVYDHWMTNIQDWCVSRQLWWGHRIPVWTIKAPNQKIAQAVAKMFGDEKMKHHTVIRLEGDVMYIATSEPEIEASLNGDPNFTQDPDVLDTWCSSWLWPFATMGWPEQTDTLKKFYPTTDLVTAPEILFFWVARMIMAGYEYMGEMPFRNVYFTGIVRDKQGRKMSKSLGNSPDPLDLIAKYGADAIRFGTMRSAPLGQDVLFDEKDVELGRNFCNKLWNACRFRQMQGGEVQGEIQRTLLTSDDKWILLKLDQAIREITNALNDYKFNEAASVLYRFFWSEYCDWYVEASKAVLAKGRAEPGMANAQSPATNPQSAIANTLAVIDFVLSHALRLFHPFLPFITEELWHGMGYAEDMPEGQGGKTIMFAPWPKPLDDDIKGHYGLDDCYLEMVDAKYDLVTQGRNLRRTSNIPAGKKVKFIFKPAQHVSAHDAEVLRLLLNAETFELNENYQPPKGTPTVQTPLGELCLPLEGVLDVAAEKLRLKKELDKIEAEIPKVEQKLANPNFVQKVPPAVLQEHQQRLAEWQGKREHVKQALSQLEGA
jgi:valyl-tRNA synthetase